LGKFTSIKKSKITYKKYLKLIDNQEMNPFEFISVSYKKGLHVWSGKYEDRKKNANGNKFSI
jgi:hypothetical protein